MFLKIHGGNTYVGACPVFVSVVDIHLLSIYNVPDVEVLLNGNYKQSHQEIKRSAR